MASYDENRLRSLLAGDLFQHSPAAQVVVDMDGRIRFINAKAAFMTGWSESELSGLPVETLVPEDARDRHVQHREAQSQSVITSLQSEVQMLHLSNGAGRAQGWDGG
jgi:PAS domain S-box-containing protein